MSTTRSCWEWSVCVWRLTAWQPAPLQHRKDINHCGQKAKLTGPWAHHPHLLTGPVSHANAHGDTQVYPSPRPRHKNTRLTFLLRFFLLLLLQMAKVSSHRPPSHSEPPQIKRPTHTVCERQQWSMTFK